LSSGTGSPQDQIQAFRTFQIGAELRAKIFGLNAAKVYGVTPTVRKAAEARDPHFLTYGPKTRREFLQLRNLGFG
jgi:uncharacterized protein